MGRTWGATSFSFVAGARCDGRLARGRWGKERDVVSCCCGSVAAGSAGEEKSERAPWNKGVQGRQQWEESGRLRWKQPRDPRRSTGGEEREARSLHTRQKKKQLISQPFESLNSAS